MAKSVKRRKKRSYDRKVRSKTMDVTEKSAPMVVSNDNECQEIPSSADQMTVPTNINHITITKLTKMPNKCYNLRPKNRQSSAITALSVIDNERSLNNTNISDLPDDCLLMIFEKLTSIRDKCYVQRVSKRFQYLIGRLLKAQKMLNVTTAYGNINSKDCHKGLSKSMCLNIVRKCPNLLHFKLPGFYTREKKPSERIGDNEMKLLSETCVNLTELDICGCGDVSENGLESVIRHCLRLERLSISFCCHINGQSFSQLTNNFKQLSLNGNEFTPYLESSLKALSQGNGKYLTELSICWYDSIQSHDSVLDLICTNFVNLKSLRWSVFSKIPGGLGIVRKLSNLTDIAFDTDSYSLDDNALIQIMCGCPKLKNVYIRIELKPDQIGITDYSLRKLPIFCPHVEKLHLISKAGYIKTITDSAVVSMVSLKKLESLAFKSFDNIGDAVIDVIKSCQRLKNLCLINCKMVTNATVVALIAAAKSQPNKRIKFSVTGPQIKRKRRKLPANLIDCTS